MVPDYSKLPHTSQNFKLLEQLALTRPCGVGLTSFWACLLPPSSTRSSPSHPAALRGEAKVAVRLHLLWTGVQERVPTESTQGEVVQGQAL